MRLRRRVTFRGNVQGVGFRATCHSIAARHAVGGCVRNLADGGVELVVEGEAAEVQAVLDAIARRMAEYIRSSAAQDEPVQGEQEFRIAH